MAPPAQCSIRRAAERFAAKVRGALADTVSTAGILDADHDIVLDKELGLALQYSTQQIQVSMLAADVRREPGWPRSLGGNAD